MFADFIANIFLSKIIVLSIDVTAVFLAFLVYQDNPKGKINKLYLATTFLMLIWVNFAYIPRLIVSRDYFTALTMLKTAWVATPLFFFLLYYLTVHLIDREKVYGVLNKIVLGTCVSLSLLTGLTDFIITGISPRGNVINIAYGSFIIPFLFLVFLMVIATLIPIFRGGDVIKNKRVQYFLFGLLIFYSFNVIFNISLPIFFGISQFYFLGDYSTLIFLGFTAFAVIKYRLFNIKVITAEIFAFCIWLLLIVRLSRSVSFQDRVIDGILFVLSIIFGFLLIQSVLNEVKQKEKLQTLTAQLEDLNKHLQDKVEERTKEVKEKVVELDRWYYLTVGRELRMAELKEKIKKLEQKTGGK